MWKLEPNYKIYKKQNAVENNSFLNITRIRKKNKRKIQVNTTPQVDIVENSNRNITFSEDVSI